MVEKPLLKYISDLGEPFRGNSYPHKSVARGMERDRRNWKMNAFLSACGSYVVTGMLSLVCVSDDPLLIPLGPSNGNYWSDQGTWGP